MSKEKQCRWKPEDWDRIFGDKVVKGDLTNTVDKMQEGCIAMQNPENWNPFPIKNVGVFRCEKCGTLTNVTYEGPTPGAVFCDKCIKMAVVRSMLK